MLTMEQVHNIKYLAIYNHLNSRLPEDNFLSLPHKLPEVQKYITNFQAYDLLLKGGGQPWKQ